MNKFASIGLAFFIVGIIAVAAGRLWLGVWFEATGWACYFGARNLR